MVVGIDFTKEQVPLVSMLLHPVHSSPQSQEPHRGGSDGNHGGQANTCAWRTGHTENLYVSDADENAVKENEDGSSPQNSATSSELM